MEERGVCIMARGRPNAESRIVPRGMRREYREKQIEAIQAQVRDTYAERIRTAKTKHEKRALKAERDAPGARDKPRNGWHG